MKVRLLTEVRLLTDGKEMVVCCENQRTNKIYFFPIKRYEKVDGKFVYEGDGYVCPKLPNYQVTFGDEDVKADTLDKVGELNEAFGLACFAWDIQEFDEVFRNDKPHLGDVEDLTEIEDLTEMLGKLEVEREKKVTTLKWLEDEQRKNWEKR